MAPTESARSGQPPPVAADSPRGRLIALLQQCYQRDYAWLERKLRLPRRRLELLVKGLEARGLVETERVEGRQIVRLTPQGRRLRLARSGGRKRGQSGSGRRGGGRRGREGGYEVEEEGQEAVEGYG